MGFVRPDAEWASLLEVIRASGSSDRDWAASIAVVARKLIPDVPVLGTSIVEHDALALTADTVVNAFPAGAVSDLVKVTPAAMAAMGREGFRRYFFPTRPVTTHLEIERGSYFEASAPAAAYRKTLGVADALGLIVHPDPGVVMVFCAMSEEPVRLTPPERQLLTRVALQLQAAARLRRRPEAVVAELDASGRVLHREDAAPPDAVLGHHAARLTRAHSRAARALPDGGTGLWPALVEGRFSLVERGSGRGKRYLVVENAPAMQPMHALDEREMDVVGQASLGLPTKMIAYALGLSTSTVSNHLLHAAAKVGAASRLELVRLAATLSRDPRAGFAETALTDAERDVLELLQRGLSNDEIARMRSRSVRTIANQVSSLLRKTGSHSRRGLFRA